MSTHDHDSDSDPNPRVPDVEDPRPSTPFADDIDTGTANDPPAGTVGDEQTTVTVDGQPVSLPPGSTLLDAVEAVDTADDVEALCSYQREDRIGPRSECRTCMVETDEHGLVPSCSFPAEDGLSVRTDASDAQNARDVNLDLVLANHNLRCSTCGQNGRCELQDTSIKHDVEHPRYGVFDDREEYVPIDDSSSVIQMDRNKCILCNRCVEACNDVQAAGVLRMEGSADDIHVGFQKPDADTWDESTCISCGHCVTVCPTGSLVEKGLVDVATLPLPGFTHKNSIGEVIEHVPAETAETSDSPNRSVPADDEPLAGDEPLDEGPSVRQMVESERSGLARAMAKMKEQAGESIRDATDAALQSVEHTAEKVTEHTLSIGSLFDVAVTLADVRLSRVNVAETTCGYCAVGCRFDVYGKQRGDDREILGVRATDPEKAPVNNISTCVKGKFGYDFVDSDERLERPLVKEDGQFREATWDEALSRVVEEFDAIREEHSSDAIAVTSSSKATNEENYLVQKFARQVLGTKHIDNCTRLCHSSTVAALKQTVGYGAMTNRINEDIGEADAYLITGANVTSSHPVLSTRLIQNVRDGADLVVFDPRKIHLADHADQYTRTEYGTDVAWINGMIRYVIENDLHDEAFVEERTKGFEDLREKVQPFTPEAVEEEAGVPPEELKSAAHTIAEADTCVFGWAMGLSQHATGTQTVLALADLALVTGHVGKPGAGLSPFRGQNNVQGGGGDMGPIPNNLPGYQSLKDEDVLDKFEDAWGVRPPDEVGLRVTEMFEAVLEDHLHGMYIVGENPVVSEPDIEDPEQALRDIDFLVVQEIFMTETAKYADVVLPAATFAEKTGTFTNTERRVQMVNPVLDPPGDARTDLDIVTELANRMGFDWDYEDSAAVMDEVNDLVPIYGGVTHERLRERGDGLQWPVWGEDHPGTPYLYEEEFNFEDGKARLVPADFGGGSGAVNEEYPFTLTTGRVLYHWHTGSMTRRVEALMSQVGESFVEIHPKTADRLGIADGEYARVTSERGSIVVRATVTDRVDERSVFVPMHFLNGRVNQLTENELDPTSYIPGYKVTSVDVTPLGPDPDAEPLSAPPADD